MDRREFLKSAARHVGMGVAAFGQDRVTRLPNIIFIYADDLGYGDVSCYGATAVRTPNVDRLATEGRLFLNAHSVAATCTPSRYALLTGEYAWRREAPASCREMPP